MVAHRLGWLRIVGIAVAASAVMLGLAACTPPPQIITTSLPNPTSGMRYEAFVKATGGTGSLRWSASGLPPTFVIGSTSGRIAGAPTATGTYTVKVTVTDSTKAKATKSLTLKVTTGETNPGAGYGGVPYQPFGQVLVTGSSWGFPGVDVISNGLVGCYSRCSIKTSYGIAYQCVELVNRLLGVKGWSPRISGDAHQIYDAASSSYFTKYPVGSGYLPVPGDVIVWRGGIGGYGHVAIVEWVSGGRIGFVEQNSSPTGRTVLNIDSAGRLSAYGSLVATGYLHAKANAGATPPPQGPTLTTGSPVAPSVHDGVIKLTGVNRKIPGSDPNVFSISQTSSGSWSGSNWIQQTGYLTQVTAVSHPDGRIDEFGVNTSAPTSTNNAFHRSFTEGSGWSDWSALPQTWLSQISAVLRSDGSIELFGVNDKIPTTTPNVFNLEQNGDGSWSGLWGQQPGYLTQITGIAQADRRIDLFGVNTKAPTTTNNAYRRTYTAATGWGDWTSLPQTWLSQISAVLRSDGYIELFGVNTKIPTTTPNIFNLEQNADGSWSGPWGQQPGYLTGISGIAQADRRIDLFGVNTYIATDSPNVFRRTYTTGAGWTEWTLLPQAWLG